MKKQTTVFTTIFGNGLYTINDPTIASKNADYLCFTDRHDLKSDVFKVINIEEPIVGDPERSAKYIRLFPNKYFETEYNIYIDAPMKLKVSPKELIEQYLSNGASMAVYKNNFRRNMKEELRHLVDKKGKHEAILMEQIATYKDDGFKDDQGLFYSGFMIRKTFDPKLLEFNNFWWDEVTKYTGRIEMSLAYSLWKTGFEMKYINQGDVFNNPFYDYIV